MTLINSFTNQMKPEDVYGCSTTEVYDRYLEFMKEYSPFLILAKNAFVRHVNNTFHAKVIRKMENGVCFKMFIPND